MVFSYFNGLGRLPGRPGRQALYREFFTAQVHRLGVLGSYLALGHAQFLYQQSVQKFIEKGIPHESYAALNEISWGNREGTRITPAEDAAYKFVLDEWLAGNEHAHLPGGESPAQVAARQRPFIELLKSRPDDEIVLVCMHGRAMRVLLCQLMGYPLSCMDGFEHQNLCLYKLHYTGSQFTIRNFLDVSHLAE